MSISKADILERVRSRQLTPEEGLKLYLELDRRPREGAYPAADTRAETPSVPVREAAADSAGIAVIGMSGRIPGARNLQEMWTFLSEGRDAVGELPGSRRHLEEPGAGSSGRWGAFLDDIDCFDPLFFEISPKEAEQMDPQQRLLLQESWKAFEDAGYPAESLSSKSCCVFIGCTQGDYLSETGIRDINPHSLTGRSVSAMAARISYFLNLRGPSVAVNTACSSSLTALVMACDMLRSGRAEMGLVGGISLMSTGTAHATMHQVGMIFPEGKCRSFDQDARGIVPGEAVGVVVLKRLADALRDGDPVYGVIRGYGINHDGRTNGLTAPSGPAQTALLLEVYERFRIDPNTIGYIEAHGTGTQLGDPIEVHALSDAFARYRVAAQRCALGSIKTNIGHTLEAAGLMGLFKVLLCLERQKLVPSLHFRKANEHIAFAGSPFYVNTRLKDWPRIDGQPLRAGVSAFGMSGTNAHVVVEEAPPRKPSVSAAPSFYLIVLSAKTPEALARRADDLWQWVRDHGREPSFSLADVAYTLQAGRSHFAYREALVVRDAEELLAGLPDLKARAAAAAETVGLPDEVFKRLKKQAEDSLHRLAGTKGDVLLEVQAFEDLADCYRQGVPLDWPRLYPAGAPQRISLPGYPFAEQRYWLRRVPKTGALEDFPAAEAVARIHPLLHENTSDLSAQRYTSRFSGDEFFLADHLVETEGQGPQKVLPGVVYLEMARAAVLAARGRAPDAGASLLFTDFAWMRPLRVERPREVHVRVFEEADARLYFEIYTRSDPAEAGKDTLTVHAEGRARIPEPAETETPATLDISRLQRQMPRELTAEACYRRIRSEGVRHGERLQGIRHIALGEGQALAGLTLPAAMRGQDARYGLHPSLMDAAIQSAIGLVMGGEGEALRGAAQPSLPFALERLEILGRCEDEMWAWMRYAPGSSPSDPVQKLDVELCDRHGNVRVRIRGLSSRPIGGRPAEAAQPEPRHDAAAAFPLHALMPVWNAVPDDEHAGLTADYDRRPWVIGATPEQMRAIRERYRSAAELAISPADSIERIAGQFPPEAIEHLVWIAPAGTPAEAAPDKWQPDESMIRAQERGVRFLFRIVKALLAAGYGERELDWTVLTFRTQDVTPRDITDPTHAGIHGLAGSLAKEYPHWTVRLLDLDSESAADWPLQTLFAVPAEPGGRALAYRASRAADAGRGPEWFRQALIRVHPLQAAAEASSRYRHGGVYVVIGGAGGIGEVWSRYMIERYRAKIVWIGRREKDEAIERQLAALPEPAAVSYFAADARDFEALENAFREIKALHPRIHGVVHSAIVLNDLSLGRMDERRFLDSLSAKVDVSVCLARVFRKEPLDFVLFFSSMQAFARAPGQSNYAAGCTFEDAFALKLARQWPYTFSNGSSYHKPVVKLINWGYWGSIGIVNDTAYRARRRDAGDGSIEPQEGMDILERFMASPFRQLAPFKALTAGVVADACGTEDVTAYPPAIPAVLEQAHQRFCAERARLPHARVEWRRLEEESHNPVLDALLLRLLDATLRSLGLRYGERPLPRYFRRWLEESLRLLDAGQGQGGPAATPERLWEEWDAAKAGWMANPNLRATVVLVETCMRALPDILTGKLAATDVMFPNSSMALVEGIYRGNVVSDYFQQALADFLVTAIEERLRESAAVGKPAPKLRILEIGAGTGGTTATILPRLRPFARTIEEYCYTDISKAFLLHAREHYAAEHPFLSTRIFNVEKPLAEQSGEDAGIAPDRYDFVIAANVLHATRDIRSTLRNAKAALRTHGILLLNELSRHSVLSHLTFGLLEGWWLYRDAPLRIPGSPGLYPETWTEILGEEGFSPVCLPVEYAASLGLQIVAAQSDGIVRQARPRLDAPGVAVAAAAPHPEGDPGRAPAVVFSEAALREKSTAYLKERVARTLKMSPRQIDSSKPLEIYGIDSILVVQLANELRKDFKKISNTLFFEVRTLDALADHLLETQKDVLADVVGLKPAAPVEPAAPAGPLRESRPAVPALRPRFAARERPAAGTGGSAAERSGPNVFDVAVIGLSGRYPQARNVDELWERLRAGSSCIGEIPASRWDWKDYFAPRKGEPGKLYTRWGGFIDDVDRFDPLFFRISPREAEAMDPQERLFLQCAYEALQDAGYTPENFGRDRKTGVFVGVMNSSYRGKPAYFSIANRISHQFDFQGPSLAVDTACSASLTALHLALESLYSGTSKRAVVGGVNLILDPSHFTALTELGMLSAGPECRSFGAGADGFIAAEGIGAVILKPLAEAIEDRDNIYGVLKGSAINAGGRTNGYTVPNPLAQAALVSEALHRAGVSAAAVSYVEAHGTGTALGDPIEIKGLAKAFAESMPDHAGAGRRSCAIGSIKSNIGHCESAAGIAGLTKVLLQMKHGQLVPSLHSATANPAIEFADTPFTVQQDLSAWQRPRLAVDGALREFPRTAGLSSFGAGGANAHVIIEEYLPAGPEAPRRAAAAHPAVIPLSAGNGERLRIAAARLLEKVRGTPVEASTGGFNLANLSYTLQVGREAMEARLAFTAASMQEVEAKLEAFLTPGDDGDAAALAGIYLTPAGSGREALNVFRADEDGAALVETWIAKKKYPKLLELWVLGFDFDWSRLYDADTEPPHRISLPTYPFLAERYWYEERVRQPQASRAPAPAAPGIGFLVRWEAQAPVPASGEAAHRRVLIVCGGSSVRLEKAIADIHRDAEIMLVRLADETRRAAPGEWLCGIGDESGFATCLRDAGDIDALYFLALDDADPAALPLQDLAASPESNEIQLLRLIKYLAGHNTGPHAIDTYILTLGNYAIEGEAVRPQGAGLTGLAYAVAQGNSRFAVRNIDLSERDLKQPEALEYLVSTIVSEPPSSTGEAIKIRAGIRYRQAFHDLAWPQPALSPIRQRGVYLILGGSGTIGRVITRHLIGRYQARVVWLGRSAPDAAKVRAALEAFSGFAEPPVYIQADATRADAVRRAVERVKSDYSAIHGAIYSALEFDPENSVEKTTEAVFRRILEVKTQGSIHFYAALEQERLDFLCYFSSGQAYAFSGAAKHAAYASGISFSDALVQALRNRAAFPVGTINWGFWKASLEPGAAVRNFACLEDEEGCDCFEKFVFALQQRGPLSQVLCFRPTPQVLALMNYRPPEDAAAAPGVTAGADIGRRADVDAYIRDVVADSFSETLKAPQAKIDPNRAFADYGLDSILGVRFVNRLNERLNIRLNTAIIFEHSSLARLGNHLVRNYRDRIEARSGAPAAGSPAAGTIPRSAAVPAVQSRPSPVGRRAASPAPPDIAVIGMSGQFPGAAGVAEFWDNLIRGIDGVREYPESYLNQATHFSPVKQPGKSYCKWGGILSERNGFDPQFFNLSPREAHSMNPHQRLVMQEGWKALEDAGYDPTRLAGSKTSIFIGAEPAGYFHESFTGASDALIASRLSYHLNLAGPALVVNTGCSSSAVAIHLACESLRSGESDLALAGGVNACMNQEALVNLSAAEMLSPRGTCATFDASADGTVISEGIGLVVLKRLEDAIADGDAIDGVICGSGINQDGASNGITAPNGLAQERLIAAVYEKFGIDPADITYVEAHGTGTKLGDPVEANALVRAFAKLTGGQAYCAVGSAKSHIGHTSAAAGVIGLIKTLLSMRHGKLPGLLHFERLNPLIEFQGSPFYINAEAAPWPSRNGAPRTAAINSFGHSGTNAHLVVREYISSAPPGETLEKPRLVPLSARTENSLRELVQDYVAFFARREDGSPAPAATLEEIAYTLQTGREAMRHRLVFAANTVSELARKMAAYLGGQTVAGCWQGIAQARDGGDGALPGMNEPLEKLAEGWCRGQDIDWAADYAGRTVRRAHLPTYRFANKEYGPKPQSARPNPPVLPDRNRLRAQLRERKSDLENAAMEALLFDLLWASLRAVGILDRVDGLERAGSNPDTDFGRHRTFPAFYRRWLDESMELLVERGYLERRAGKLYSPEKAVAGLDTLWERWDQEKPRWLDNPYQRAQAELVEACVRALPRILTGQKLATDIMFPDGGMALVEGVYQNNPVSDYFNTVLGEALVAAVQARLRADAGAKIRILEIGAGTGGTTRGLLKQLAPFGDAIADYCYTDLSKAFLNHAKRHYAPGNAYLSTRILDIDKPLGEQGVAVGHFDFAVATNVLHATGNIRRTLRHARSALRPGGRLLINEMSGKSLFVHLTFGLLEGWWLYDDPELRIPGIPGLYPEVWARVLAEAGFASVSFPAEEDHGFGQQIIVAENGGEMALPEPASAAGGAMDGQGPHDFVTQVLTEELADALQMDIGDIAPDQAFADYGLDSLLGINFIRMVNRRLGLDLETVAIFDYNSVRRLSGYIIETYRDKLSASVACPASAGKTPEDTAKRSGETGSGKASPVNTAGPSVRNHGWTATADDHRFAREPIAIVGMSGRFAQSPDLEALWNHLAAGKDLVRKASRWNLSEFFPRGLAEDPNFCTDGGFMDDIDRFDPLFFKISGTEATYMDPQQRLFLETAWSALEDAGYAVDGADGKQYGVFLGYGGSDYAHLFDTKTAPAQAFWGNSASIIPARIAYYLNIKGPAVTVDTACSGSLVAIHMACQTLWTREIDLALAGAVSVMCTPGFYRTGTRAGMLSPSGRCRSFDAKADGFIPGEGVGVVTLKRLSDALADGDAIHGVIRGIGVNQDGSTNGITAPSAKSQERLERQVYDRFRIDPAGIRMVEAHGTGTQLGDPIEVTALTRAFRAYTDKAGYCALGSIKSNIGHAGPAAGIAGLFKILLAMRHGKIPASLHFEQVNPEIRFEGSPFYVNTRLQDWNPAPGDVRRAALSSFGFSGTNAHLVIEEAPAAGRRHDEKPAWLIALSARSRDQLVRRAEDLLEFCARAESPGKPPDLGNLSYTLLVKRKHWNHRWSCVAASLEDLVGMLGQWLNSQRVRGVHLGAVQDERIGEQSSLKRHGDECLDRCLESGSADGYTANLETVADLYVQGYVPDFRRLFSEGHQTLSLPTYPFAREKYWVEPASEQARSRFVAEPPANSAATPDMLAAVQEAAAKEASPPAKNWFFVREEWVDSPLAEALDWKARLGRFAGKVIWAVYTNPRDRDAFARLLSQLQAAAGLSPPLSVQLIHAHEIGPDLRQPIPEIVLFLGPSNDLDPMEQSSAGDIAAVYRLSRFLMRRAWEEPVRIYYLYACASAAPRLDCEALSGLLGTAMMENPNHAWTSIGRYDGEPEPTGLQLLVREWLADGHAAIAGGQGGRESAGGARIFHSRTFPRVRYRRSNRQIGRRVQASFDDAAPPVFRPRKTYLVAGGLGLIGEELCTELARRYRATLVILSRRAYDPQRQAQCETLRALGAEVHYHSVDVTDRSALRGIYAEIKRRLGPIHGVFHLANTVEGGLIAGLDWESFRQMGDVKTRGTLYLDELTADEPLEFFILFSSIVAFGIRGSAGYSYACAFLNRFAAYRNRLKDAGKRAGHTVSLCWGPWTSDPVHAGADKDRRRKIDADGFDLIPIGAAFPLLDRCPAQGLDAIGIWAVRDPVSVCRHMDVETDRRPAETPADPAGKHREAKGLVWEARVSAWEREIREGRPLSAETLAEAIDLGEIESLEPDLIRRIHRLLFQDGDAPPRVEPADEPSTPAEAPRPPAEEILSLQTSPEAEETDEGRRAQFKETPNKSSPSGRGLGEGLLLTRPKITFALSLSKGTRLGASTSSAGTESIGSLRAGLIDQSVAQAASPSWRLDQSFLKTIIREVASDLLKVQDMDEREAFQNYGMDSVFGVQLAIRLEKRLGREIQPRWLIDFPSIRALSEHLQELEAVADAE